MTLLHRAQEGWQARVRYRRRRLGSLLADLHVQLRAPSDSPARTGMSVWLGTAVGVLPVYGLHLILCVGLARCLRLSALTAYLAAHVNNPVTAPLLLYLSLGTGRWLTTGKWASIRFEELRAAGVATLGADLLLGSVVLGGVLGGALAAVAYVVRRRWGNSPDEVRLAEATARRYLEAGIFHWEFVGGKLRHDPLYLGLLQSGALCGRRHVLDLGCGRGIALALVAEAGLLARRGEWPTDWGEPLDEPELVGVERSERLAAVARAALGERAQVVTADLATLQPRSADAVLLLDVLHYLPAATQVALSQRIAAVLEAGGVLILREPAAGAGWRFLMTRFAERLCAIARRDWRQRFFYRSVAEWEALLAGLGLHPESTPMSRGTPYANVLIVARKPLAAARRNDAR